MKKCRFCGSEIKKGTEKYYDIILDNEEGCGTIGRVYYCGSERCFDVLKGKLEKLCKPLT